jgi:tetratricopeptide (TPR) repeat protein
MVLVLAIGLSLGLIYKPWERLRYGHVEPPLPVLEGQELPLQRRIQERVEQVRAKPYDAAVWGKLGETYDVHELFAEADVCYARAATLGPDEVRWPYLRGVLLSIGDQQAAIAAFERALALQPNLAAAHYQLGKLFLAGARLEEAQRSFSRALELEPRAVAAQIGLANVALAQSDAKRALELLELAEKIKPGSAEVRRIQAAAWRVLGDEDKAQILTAQAGASPAPEPFPDPLRAESILAEGVTLKFARARAENWLARGDPKQAVAELNAYLEQNPKFAPALVSLADLYMKTDQVEDALPRYQAAATLDPTNSAALVQWGIALTRTGRSDLGIEKLRQALALEPTRAEFRANLGAMLCGSEDAELRTEGLSLLAEVAKQLPDDASMQLNFAQALRSNERHEEALAAFERALLLAPGNARARFEYGLLCAQMGRFDNAVDAFERVIELEPTRMTAHDNLIWTLTRMGSYRDAIEALRIAQPLAPKNYTLRGQLAWLLATCPDDGVRSGAESLAITRELVEITQAKNPEFLVMLGAAQAETGEFKAAIASVDQALELMKPKEDVVSDPALVGIIQRALACKRAFEAGQGYRLDPVK